MFFGEREMGGGQEWLVEEVPGRKKPEESAHQVKRIYIQQQIKAF